MDQDCGGHKCPLALSLRKHGPLRLGRVIAGELKAVVAAAALFAGVFSPLFAASAQAGIGFPAEIRRLGPPIERVQYFTLGGDDYCWYSDGWNGPGWYECGDQEIYGFGWGGANGWNGWGGGDHIRRHGYHGVGVYHPGRQPVVGDALGVEGGELEPR
jgi:hypothetical protein